MTYFGEHTPKLGFGMMRLPRTNGQIDIEETKRMVDVFMAAGLTYFDTAYVYEGSEEATRIALVERYPRDSYTLASKINAKMMCHDEASCQAQLKVSFERTGAGYKFVAKNPHACVWDESHISLDIYLEKNI